MLSTFRETIISFKDPAYGQTIISRSYKYALWYWTKYFILFSLIPLLIFIAGMTYFVPQIPDVLKKLIPGGQYTLTQSSFSTSIKEPIIFKNDEFYFSVNPTGSADELPANTLSLLVASQEAILREPNGQVIRRSYSGIPSFSFSSTEVIAWVRDHLSLIWLIGTIGIILIGVLSSALIWLFRVSTLLFWGGAIYLFSRLLKHPLSYAQSFNISAYASVISILASSLFSFFPEGFAFLVGLLLIVFTSYRWISHLPK